VSKKFYLDLLEVKYIGEIDPRLFIDESE